MVEHKRVHASGRTRLGVGVGMLTALPRVAEFFGHPTVTLVVMLLTQFSAALLLAQGRFLGRFAPFGVAFVSAAACFPFYGKTVRRLMPCAALFGAAAGYLIAGGAVDGLKYLAASVLCFAAGLIFRGTAIPGRFWFAPAVAGTALGLTDLACVLAASRGAGEVLLFVCEVILTGCAAMIYLPVIDALHGAREEKREKPPNSFVPGVHPRALRRMAAAGTCLSLILVLADFTPFYGMSLGRMAGLYVTLAVCAAAGPLAGCAAGLLSGLAIDLALSGTPSVALIYAAAGLFAGAFRRHGPLWTAICFTVAHAALLPWVWPAAPMAVLYECFAAGVVWFLSNRGVTGLFRRVGGDTAALAAPLSPGAPPGGGQMMLSRLRTLTEAFRTVGDAVRVRTPPAAESAFSSYDVAVERVCRTCPQNALCWRREYPATRTALNEAAEKIRSRGRAHAQDFPPFFTARCERLGEFVANVNEHIALRESRSRYRRLAADDARMLGAQYDAATQVLSEITGELAGAAGCAEEETRALRRALASRGIALQADVVRAGRDVFCRLYTAMELPCAMQEEIEEIAADVTGRDLRAAEQEDGVLLLREAERLRAVVGVGLRQRRGEDASGDSAAYFRTDDGRLYMLIADGMGSGRDAARESAAFCRMMEGFLRAGVSVRTALELLGPAFTVKCGGETFTTSDVLCVDLHTGESECFKCGAAPTYVCSAATGGVRRICSASMPVGLPSESPEADYTRLCLEIGDVVVMVSDGLTENEEDAWLTSLLAEHRFTSAAALASLILDAGTERSGGRDDMTVLALKLSAAR